MRTVAVVLLACFAACAPAEPPKPPPAAAPAPAAASGSDVHALAQREASAWRNDHRLIDLHEHIDPSPEHLARAVKILDAVGIGIAVNLSGGGVTPKQGPPPECEVTKARADQLHPGRFVHYMNLDYTDFDRPDFPALAVHQVEEGARLGAAGFKEFKRLGLYLRDGKKNLIRIDDPKLDP